VGTGFGKSPPGRLSFRRIRQASVDCLHTIQRCPALYLEILVIYSEPISTWPLGRGDPGVEMIAVILQCSGEQTH
jgi:hypothetical protein